MGTFWSRHLRVLDVFFGLMLIVIIWLVVSNLFRKQMTWQDYRWEEYRQDSTELYVRGDIKGDVTDPCTKATRDYWRAGQLNDLEKRIQEHYRYAEFSMKNDSLFMASYDRLLSQLRTVPVRDESNVTSKPCPEPIVSYAEYQDSLSSRRESHASTSQRAETVGSIMVRGTTITRGELADDVFEILKPNDLVSQNVFDDYQLEGSKIIHKIYNVKGKTFSISFRRREAEGPYVVEDIYVVR